MTPRARLAAVAMAIALCAVGSVAATRWSANHIIPDADLISGGEFAVDVQGFYFQDEDAGAIFKPTFLLRLGIIEYVNIEGGYGGGATFGLKARILGETHPFMPSVAVGAHNVFSHKEAYYYDAPGHDKMVNELYLALGKTIESISMRFHLGVQTIPQERTELVNPFLGIENYFGGGLYTTLEIHRRREEIIPSLFVSYRFLQKRLEVSAGFVDLNHLFLQNGEFGFTFVSSGSTTRFTRPGVWIGLRFLGDVGFGKRLGFITMEERIRRQARMIDSLQWQIDMIQRNAEVEQKRLSRLSESVNNLLANNPGEYARLKSMVLDKIVAMKSLYETNPFEPEKVKEVVAGVTVYQDRVVGPLKEILSDKSNERLIRMYAAMLLGEIGRRSSADALLAVLGADEDPGIKIEALIALGKMRETRAVYLMEQLANDPDDGVAIAAREVLQRLQRETGVRSAGETTFWEANQDSIRSAVEHRLTPAGVADSVRTAPEKKPPASDASSSKKAAETAPAGSAGNAAQRPSKK